MQNNDFQIMSRAASHTSTVRPHYHMKCHRKALSFSPSDCFPQSCYRGSSWGGGIHCSPPVNNGAQNPGRRNLTVYPGAIFDDSEWL